jgi:hypothetical protein
MATKELTYADMSIDDIIEWCKENGEVEWLKEIASQKVEYKIYPRVKVDDKWTTDKTATPKVEKRPISFIQLKIEFVKKFMPNIMPKAKSKKPTMFDKIKAL